MLITQEKNIIEVVENAFNEGVSGKVSLNDGAQPDIIDDKDALAISEQVQKISFDQFQQLSTTYDLNDDKKMVEFINKFCDQNGVNPLI